MVATANSFELAATRAAMAQWKDGAGRTPFGMAAAGHAEDRCGAVLGEAVSLASMLSAACTDASALGEKSEFAGQHMEVLARALSGLGTLIDLAAFMVEE